MAVIKKRFSFDVITATVDEYLNSKLSFDLIGGKHGMTGGNVRHWVIKLGHKPRKNGDWK